MFADAAWSALQTGIKDKLVCTAPEKMRYADTYLQQARVRISSLAPLPTGWTVGHPNLTAAWHDGLMSRWLDDETIASNRKIVVGADGKKTSVPVAVERLRARVKGSMVLLFGEETLKSGRYRVYLDGKLLTHIPWGKKEAIDYYDPSAKAMGGNRQHAQVIVPEMDPAVEHVLEIEPIFLDTEEQELRLESICVAGSGALVRSVN
jgi:microcompartment protein CcmL/EutN